MAMKKQLLLALALVLISAVFITACREARMAAPQQVTSQAQEWAIKETRIIGWDSPFNFGPYHVANVQRGWQETTAWGFLGYENYKSKQQFQYTVQRAGGQPWVCNCATGVGQQVLQGMIGGGTLTWELTAATNFACSLKNGDKIWRMVVASQGSSKLAMQGVLQGPGKDIQVKGTHELEGSSLGLSDPTGYTFYSPQGPIAAVQVINNGIVWMLPGPDQDALAAASAGLLLYKDVSRD